MVAVGGRGKGRGGRASEPIGGYPPACLGAPVLPAFSINVHPGGGGDEDGSRVRAVLRSDAAEVLSDKAAMGRLAGYKALTGTGLITAADGTSTTFADKLVVA